MDWIALDGQLPTDAVLVYTDGDIHLAVLVDGPRGSEPKFMDLHALDILPWPSHWMRIPEPPDCSRRPGFS